MDRITLTSILAGVITIGLVEAIRIALCAALTPGGNEADND
ncbi:hypothetical protein SAMN05216337_101784 [Bradyrhizobium brasilense]|uniref:Uncharacterized protein n=1 Tax=Bradyrhizobium brasilense TaxID=1419277 RepID=A0A1G6YV61_9BRAD|nr:hypothetical protein [Bradyrhizobium brasilense]SDD93476.1 hypothetical protein SAMN05216337_101784 [Bradyrhizobium brasilense]